MYRKKLLDKQPEWLRKYTSSMIDDREIAAEVLQALKVHINHLTELNLIPKNEANKVAKVVDDLIRDPSPLFSIKAEDVHEAIEIYLKNKVGRTANWISLGKSRNDHVSAALRLHTRTLTLELLSSLNRLREALIGKAQSNIRTIMPGFTHLQPAQPITLAHYLLYIEEELSCYFNVLRFLLNEIVEKSPLGAAAIAGTIVPLNRKKLAKMIGMSKIVINTLAATSARNFLTLVTATTTSLQVFLSRIAEDLIIWSTPQFNYITPHEHHLATSSIMPHKRNPITMEIVRARSGESIGSLMSILSIIKGLPSGYNLDLQEISRHAWKVLKNAIESATVLADFILKMKVNAKKMSADAEKYMTLTAYLAEYISMKQGAPYREMHQLVAEAVKCSRNFNEVIKYVLNKLKVKLEPPSRTEELLEMKKVLGSPREIHVKLMIQQAAKRLKKDAKGLEKHYNYGDNEI